MATHNSSPVGADTPGKKPGRQTPDFSLSVSATTFV
jgi:hypothetical protein